LTDNEDYSRLAHELTDKLGLDTPPVALAFVNEQPAGVEALSAEGPSSCSFWRLAEQSVFYAPAAKHFNCAVGAMTMGFQLPQPVMQKLTGTVELMCSAGYITPDEPGAMPTVQGGHTGIVYGPLADFPQRAHLVVLWVTPRQAMLFNESAGEVRWSGASRMHVYGRPACSALPVALSESRPTLSLGCLGMRTFTEISDDRLLAVVPAAELEEFVSSLGATCAANATMGGAYDAMKAEFAGS
jgi:uncharacterized protein (DUF169 family)